MNSFQFNKFAGALLATALLMMGINAIGNMLVHPEGIESAHGSATEAAAPEAATAHDAVVKEAAKAPAGPSFAELLAGADIGTGAKISRKCAACHTFTADGGHRVGPNLWGVMGRDIASGDGYSYSSALAGVDGVWSDEAMDAFLAKPKTFAPGTKMSFAGLKKPTDRAAMIVYLRSQGDGSTE